ncbi:type II toxin-antitoxin system MqsA family antitoxin [Hymenobacter sp. J193]|uniref:type II toxin-antitoxin system MqsA family antitoxin n=1 Tax=Hymenobacter sp. J193 TaxID=2898429 RepID=UPI002150D18B|nr:type II toxin-antitoxin system MqsA family antitoxin [Hymenobacter sp. J193]MCR5886689.1 type II toxin-antitoxin system MqsA family antitoxin [Hymenobacter sp. J193]
MMVSPFTGGAVREIQDTQRYTFRGEQFEVTAPVYECEDTGEQFTTNEQDEEFISRLHAQWRETHRVPTPEQLRYRREELELSMREMSDLLGLGVNQWRQYEAGEMPSNSNVLLLQLVCSIQGLAAILAQRGAELPARTQRKLQALAEEPVAPVIVLPRVQQELPREQVRQLLALQGGSAVVYMGGQLRPRARQKTAESEAQPA